MQEKSDAQPALRTHKAVVGFALSLVSGILVLIQGIMRFIRGKFLEIGIDFIRRRILAGVAFQVVGVIAVVFAILIIIGAFLIYSPGNEMTGGIIVLVFAVLSIITGGGFLAGFILGIIGGILGLLKT